LRSLIGVMLLTRWRLAVLAVLATAVAAKGGSDVSDSVATTVEGRLMTELPLDAVRVVLNGGMYMAMPRQDGTFKLHHVAPGQYLLEVLDTQSVWPTVRLDVSAAASGKARALLMHTRQPLPFPLPLEPLVAKPVFFEKREGFNWSQMLMNPMVLMMGVTVLIMFVMPKMMQNMDPDQLKEMQSMQGGFSDLLNPDKLKEKMEAIEKKAEKPGSGNAARRERRER